MDDPLSAVDAHVSLDLFNDVVGPTGVLNNSTRVLVTHSVAVLPHVDRIVVLENGEITHQGTYEEMMSANVRLKELVETHAKPEETTTGDPDSPLQAGKALVYTVTFSDLFRRNLELLFLIIYY